MNQLSASERGPHIDPRSCAGADRLSSGMRGAFGRVDIGQARASTFPQGGARGKKNTTGRFRDRIFGEENWDSMGCFDDFSGISGGKELMFGYLEDTRSCS